MTLPKKLKEILCSKLQIKERQLHNLTKKKMAEGGIAKPDIALLLLAHENGINISKPMFSVPQEKIVELEEYLKTPKVLNRIQILTPVRTKMNAKQTNPSFHDFYDLKGNIPRFFMTILKMKLIQLSVIQSYQMLHICSQES